MPSSESNVTAPVDLETKIFLIYAQHGGYIIPNGIYMFDKD